MSAGDRPFDLEEIAEAFELLDDWNERYRYLIELGKELPALSEAEHDKANKVDGCMSQVWLVADVTDDDPPRFVLRADSDAFIVKGLIAVLLAMFSHRTKAEILEVDAKATFDRLGLAGHLSMGRRNGLESMVKRVRDLAAAR
ncbi:MAG: SufE family protein [Sandaracinaceae bacterium]